MRRDASYGQHQDQDGKIQILSSQALSRLRQSLDIHMSYSSLGPLHRDADGFHEPTTAPQLYSPIGSTCLCPPGTILVQGLCKLMTNHHSSKLHMSASSPQ